MEAANVFLAAFWPRFNASFAVAPKEAEQVFSPLLPSLKATLPEVLCQKLERSVGNDNCVSYKGRTLQIPPQPNRCHLRAGQGAGPRVRGRRHGGLPTAATNWAGTTRTGACRPRLGQRHERRRRPTRLAPLASQGGGLEKRIFHVLHKPDILFAPDRGGVPEHPESHILVDHCRVESR